MSFKAVYKRTMEINKSKFSFPNTPIFEFIFRELSFFLTPFFIIGKLSPNKISVVNYSVRIRVISPQSGLRKIYLILFDTVTLESRLEGVH